MEVYLDNSATTKCYENVREIVGKIMCDDYGNPSSMHRKGVEAERYIKEATFILIFLTLKPHPHISVCLIKQTYSIYVQKFVK